MDFLSALTQPQAIILAGVLGVVTALAANVITHQLTVRGQDKRRWDSRRMDAYADYARAVKKIVFLAVSVGAARGLPYHVAPLPVHEGVSALALAEEERAAQWEPVLLLGGSDVVAAARAWHQCAWHLVEFAHGRLTDTNEWNKAVDAIEATFLPRYGHQRG